MAHSPAPWTVNEAWGYIEIIGSDGKAINDPELNQSDAALIAAAPIMYKALVLTRLKTEDFDLDEAIANAEGRKGGFINWFQIRKFASKNIGGGVHIPIAGVGYFTFTYDEVMAMAGLWDSLFSNSAAEPTEINETA
jgi:hypothetical protein